MASGRDATMHVSISRDLVRLILVANWNRVMVTRKHQSHTTLVDDSSGVRTISTWHARNLEQARGAQTGHRISNRHWFPLEKPAGHRESQCRVTDVKKLHISTPS